MINFSKKNPFENITTPSPESKENEKKELPCFELYLLRHGQSEKDKTNPNRGLTEKGVKQVESAMENIIKDLIKEEMPDFNEWDNQEKISAALSKLKDKLEFQLKDSGTERTKSQVQHEYNFLLKMGIAQENIFLPQSMYDYLEKNETDGGPGVAKRLKGVQGLDQNPEFRKLLKDPEYRKKVEATSDFSAWANSTEDEIPPDIETLTEMKNRYQMDINKAERVINYKMKDYPKRVITIANSHASIATLAAAEELGLPIKELMAKINEVPEAQGLKYNFFGPGNEKEVKPFGPDMERAVAELKE